MATIRSYIDLEQSKKLAEILPLESADMTYYACVRDWRGNPITPKWKKPANLTKEELALPCSNFQEYEYIPCWSLAALLGVLPKDEGIDCSISFGYYNSKGEYIEKWLCAFEKEGETTDDFIIETIDGDNPIDACVEMVIKLHELNLL